MKMKTMMTLMLLVFCLLPLSAEIETWQETKNAMLSVDLEDPQRIFTGASNATYDSGYFDSDLIGLVGVIDRTDGLADDKMYTFSFDFLGSDWTYRSASDSSVQIPYGIQLVARYTGDHTYEGEGSDGGILTFGYTEDSTIESGTQSSIDIKVSELNQEENVSAIWMDIILVLPMEPRSDFVYGPADDYLTTISMTVTESTLGENEVVTSSEVIANYQFIMSGYYQSEAGSSTAVAFSITPGAASYALSIDELETAESVDIGDFYYTTQISQSTGQPSFTTTAYSLFASSSDDPTKEGERFIMKHTEALDADLNKRNGFYFDIGLQSNASGRLATSESIQWYDGTDTVSSTGNEGTRLQSSMRIERNQNNWLYSYYDDGDILIRYAQDGNEERNLVGGGYTADIYIHLVSNE